jgi:isoquinoline 1-oxidoreductase subunit alpha
LTGANVAIGRTPIRGTVITLKVNGKSFDVDVEVDTPLLWVLRDTIGLTGTKYGCGVSECGACTVHIDGRAERSCAIPAGSVVGAEITTIEGLAEDETRPVLVAWIEEGVPQCGYCQPGLIMTATALLSRTPNPTDADIDRGITNICRCGTYAEIRRAIQRASALITKGRKPDKPIKGGGSERRSLDGPPRIPRGDGHRRRWHGAPGDRRVASCAREGLRIAVPHQPPTVAAAGSGRRRGRSLIAAAAPESFEDHAKHDWLRTLDVAAEKSNWGQPLPTGTGMGFAIDDRKAIPARGIAIGAIVARVSVARSGQITVDRIDIVYDQGHAIINPEAAERQLRGQVAWSMGPATAQEITFRDGRVVQSNFHDYPMIRLAEFPKQINIHYVKTNRWISGVGEEIVPLVAPAIYNAIFAATGKRIRSMPLRHHDLRWS